MNRLRAYLHSPRNIAGCSLAFVGLVLLFAGVIGTGWPLIVAGLYAAGALAWPQRKQAEPPAEPAAPPEIPLDAIAQHLEAVVAEAADVLPAAAIERLHTIQATLEDLLPRLRELEDSRALSMESSFTVHETLRRYLPDMLTNYLNLPPTFATQHKLHDGRTSAQALVDQLQVLDELLQKIAHEAFIGDAQALVDTGRTLERKLRAKAVHQVQ
jgi:hypothetical protein